MPAYMKDDDELGVKALPEPHAKRHRRRYARAVLRAMERLTNQDYGKLWLDVGCGSGYGTELIDKFTYQHGAPKQIIGIDINKTAIEYAKSHHANERINFFNVGLKTFHQRCSNECASAILCVEVIEHVNYFQRVLVKQMKDTLKPIGVVVITTPLKEQPTTNSTHTHELTYDELAELMRPFENVEIIVTEPELFTDGQMRRQMFAIGEKPGD